MNMINETAKRSRNGILFLFLTIIICIVSAAAFFTNSVTDHLKVTVTGMESVNFSYQLSSTINNATEVTVKSPGQDILLAVNEENTDSRDLFRNAKLIAQWSKGTDINRVTFKDTYGNVLSGITYDEVAEEITIPLANSTRINAGNSVTHYIKVVLDSPNGSNDTINQDTLTFSIISDVSAVKDSWSETVGPVELKLHTKFSQSKYTVQYHANGGTGTMAIQEFIFGTAQNLSANNFTRTGYTFAGWAVSDNSTVIYTDKQMVNNLTETDGGIINLYAVWKPNTYSVKFNANGGSGAMSNQSFTYGTAQNLTANSFSRTGYTFAGWATSANGGKAYSNSQSVSNLTSTSGETVTLYAVWTANSYTVKYNSNGGSGSMSNQSFTYGTAQNLTANSFTRSGYTFAGWATSANGSKVYSNSQSVSNLTSTSGGTVNLYAVWTPNSYTVTFNANGGSGSMSNQSFTYGTAQNLTANSFTRTGYTFAGWATSASGSVVYSNTQSVSNLATSGTVNLYAKWAPNTYTVQFNANGGSGNMSNQTFTYDSSKALAANGFTAPSGKVFGGWATSSNGSAVYTDKQSVSNLATSGTITLYAKWITAPILMTAKYSVSDYGPVQKAGGFYDYQAFITDIEFKTTYSAPSNATYGPWDVSYNGDGSVMAYCVTNGKTITTSFTDGSSVTRNGVTLYICSNVGTATKVVAPANSSYLFAAFYHLQSFNGTNLDFSQVTNASYFLSDYKGIIISSLSSTSLTVTGITNWDTSNVRNMSYFFWYSGVYSLDLSGWDTSNVTTFKAMFDESGIHTLDMRSWSSASCSTMVDMFKNLGVSSTRKIYYNRSIWTWGADYYNNNGAENWFVDIS